MTAAPLPVRRDDIVRWGKILRAQAKSLPGGLPETPRGLLTRVADEMEYLIVRNPVIAFDQSDANA